MALLSVTEQRSFPKREQGPGEASATRWGEPNAVQQRDALPPGRAGTCLLLACVTNCVLL